MFSRAMGWQLNQDKLEVKFLLFLVYYVKLRLRLLFGFIAHSVR
jgi:hypothetical protein